VRRSGVRIGEVRDLRLDDENARVLVGILLERKHPLYRGDRATLVHGLLSGDTSIDLVPTRRDGQPADRVPLEPGAVVEGASQPDMAALLNQAADIVPSAQESLNQMRVTLQRLEKMTPGLEETLKEYRELAKESRTVVPDVRRATGEAEVAARNWGRVGERVDLILQENKEEIGKLPKKAFETADQIEKSAEKFGRFVDNADTMRKDAEKLLRESLLTLKQVNETIHETKNLVNSLDKATRPLAERSPEIAKNLDEATAKANALLGDLREVMKAVGEKDGTVGRFLTDPALYNHLNDSACMLTRILPRVDRILRDLEVFADKIARHPEALGLGGVVSPSSGLKTAPAGSTSGWRGPGH